MRSRPARLTLSALAWIALGAAAFFCFTVQQQIDQRQAALRAFESSARDAADALDDAQAGQQSYVAAGQDAREWTPKVTTFLQTAASSIDVLRASALSQAAGPSLLEASTAMTQIGNVDRRVREHLSNDDTRGAADVVFSEAADAVSSAVSDVDTAVAAEQQGADVFLAEQRRAQIYALGGVGGLVAIILAILGFAAPAGATAANTTQETHDAAQSGDALATVAHQAVFDKAPNEPPAPLVASPDAQSLDALRGIAGLCTEFGRARDATHLKALLEKAADLLNARGIIVWLGSTAGADLRPVLAHGYTDSTLARIPIVARSADNAAAAAYRSGEVQVVRSRPGASQGAIVAPLMATEGCIGALTAEIRDRGEESDTTRAIALIIAAQLSGVLASAADSAPATGTDVQSAAG